MNDGQSLPLFIKLMAETAIIPAGYAKSRQTMPSVKYSRFSRLSRSELPTGLGEARLCGCYHIVPPFLFRVQHLVDIEVLHSP
jgi:hypothetical protein